MGAKECDLSSAPPSESDLPAVTMCGCPEVDTAVQECVTFEVGKCSPLYAELDETEGVLAYVKPIFNDPDEEGDTTVTVYPYADKDCTSLNFQPSSENGWEGKCNEECWSETVSKWGAHECDLSSAPLKSALVISIPVFVLAMILF